MKYVIVKIIEKIIPTKNMNAEIGASGERTSDTIPKTPAKPTTLGPSLVLRLIKRFFNLINMLKFLFFIYKLVNILRYLST